ncbi:MAG TPA: chemotaxis protein CheX [Methylomusa anaerophila]|uniref:CheY-P phosphatase CheX n=1 Tax=Methylomusa anaerophila TaxID=1930071 RepID=A0A348AJU4_9FIRM|nr:chemotaxis protein CheX [Methylomusa anaerophila]BBB91342.1 CheY-P phosphatase CheX [Methylomusa anaerophila]HML90484.1 chemotaxis protein CheX [Methylomusa anaerophila]
MDVKLINPFVDAVAAVMPQLGFAQISRGGLSAGDQYVTSKGLTVVVGVTNALTGSIAYNMTEDTARKIASTMMMGMPVAALDDMAQSAISEMVNMVTSNAVTSLGKMGVVVKLLPPGLVVGDNSKIKVSESKFLAIEIMVDSERLELNFGLGT